MPDDLAGLDDEFIQLMSTSPVPPAFCSACGKSYHYACRWNDAAVAEREIHHFLEDGCGGRLYVHEKPPLDKIGPPSTPTATALPPPKESWGDWIRQRASRPERPPPHEIGHLVVANPRYNAGFRDIMVPTAQPPARQPPPLPTPAPNMFRTFRK